MQHHDGMTLGLVPGGSAVSCVCKMWVHRGFGVLPPCNMLPRFILRTKAGRVPGGVPLSFLL